MMKCKDCKHYNGATMPGAGLCNATQARTFATTVCFNGLFSPKKRKDKPDSKAGKNSATLQEIAAGVAVFFSTAAGRSPFYPFVFLLYGNPFADGSARRDMLFPVQRYCLGGTFKYRYAI